MSKLILIEDLEPIWFHDQLIDNDESNKLLAKKLDTLENGQYVISPTLSNLLLLKGETSTHSKNRQALNCLDWESLETSQLSICISKLDNQLFMH